VLQRPHPEVLPKLPNKLSKLLSKLPKLPNRLSNKLKLKLNLSNKRINQ
jgi:hypothetical protein